MDEVKKTILDFDNTQEKAELTIKSLLNEVDNFCNKVENNGFSELYGSTDGKAIGTYIERKFKEYIDEKYKFDLGNAAKGIDLPGEHILTDIKVTRITQPQSSSPFRDAKQKIYGLGYNLLLFVYEKRDNHEDKKAYFNFVSTAYIDKKRTADFTLTRMINDAIKYGANEEDIFGLLVDKNLPGDEITLTEIAKEIIENPPVQGYLTISNALQWRLQYKRIVDLKENEVEGVIKLK
ncbi:restriction endonuclease [Staphylococcus felis]|uniref:restriction endonuclease n=1 Tax=Staphylococcus felis TaxID=46127 RepID=UPI000E26B4A7|nr:restriction endonuclease [Staphylococcus felis]REI13021.1 restriction endonuclease [Staphylococcus felis]